MILYVYKPPIIASHQKVDPITLSLFHPACLAWCTSAARGVVSAGSHKALHLTKVNYIFYSGKLYMTCVVSHQLGVCNVVVVVVVVVCFVFGRFWTIWFSLYI